jgi:hypothetical protein
MKTLYLAVLGVGMGACSSPPASTAPSPAPPANVICTMEARAGIVVQPVDASTGASVTGMTTLRVRTGMESDSARVQLGDGVTTVAAAYERAGTYTVTVQHPLYRDWTQTGVVVNRDECHVIPVRLRAELVRR